MSVEVRQASDDERADWDDIVAQSPQGNFFHQYDALQVQASHAGASLHPLIGFKGQEPVGIFPIFEINKGPFTAAFSPPPHFWIPTLGPALVNLDKMKRRKAERRHQHFINGCFNKIHEELRAQYIYVRTHYRYEDVRPFEWNDCTMAPLFTYLVDLQGGKKEVKMRCSSDLRSNIRKKDDLGANWQIEVGQTEDVKWIIEQVQSRFKHLNASFDIPSSFGADLQRNVPDGQVKPYVCRVDGERMGGVLITEFDGTVHRWLGGKKPPADLDLPINDLLDWRVITDAMSRDLSTYDLVGAGIPRINNYKSKFNPELVTFYRIEGGGWIGRQLVNLYKKRHVLPIP